MTDTAVQQLADIREQWGDLLCAIGTPPAPVWPPRQLRHSLDAADTEPGPQVGRLPLTLRQHPAPLNLDALDAAMAIERGLFDLADRLAAAHQRPMATIDAGTWGDPGATVLDPRDDDPARWHYAGVRDLGRASGWSAGSRALGLHWCAVWIEDRLTQAEPTDLHGVVRGVLRDHAERVTAEAHRILLAALGRDGRDTRLDDPCPWCHGVLTARTTSGDPHAATITCDTGPTCTAPAPYDHRARRVWHGRDLVGLFTALTAARAKETAA